MLKEKIQQDLNASLKSGDQLKRLVLGMLMTAVKNKELAKRQQLSKTIGDITKLEEESQLTDDVVTEVVAGEVKRRREAIEQFKAGARDELAEKEKKEMEILLSYLPEQMSEDAIRAEVQKIIVELGAARPKDMGRVISGVMAKLKGRADGFLVSRLVKESLG